jgi:hypothetical protein
MHMKLDLKNNFIDELENLYKTHLIYRTIVVCNNDIIEYKKLLEDKEFSVYVIDTISNINYDTLDYRILLIKSELFEEFLSNVISNKMNNFYTFIKFTYENDVIKEQITKKYYNNQDIMNNII